MLKYGFFIRTEEAAELIEHLREIDLLSVPTLAAATDPV